VNIHVSNLDNRPRSDGEQLRLSDIGGEHPDVVVHDVASRPRPQGHVIVFANEKGGVGKSTLAFHTAIALANSGLKVAVVDLDTNQATAALT
jgi:chromosome partitioning protein